ncbi:MAG: alginate lyase family protein [Pyrinomonadaceae bacterium]
MNLVKTFNGKMRLLKIFTGAIIFTFLGGYANAQTISLSNPEVAKLQKLIQNDASAAKQFSPFLKLADESLQDAPDPIETITTEGRLKGNPQKTATAESLRDMRKIYALAIVYRVKTDDKYLKKADEFLTVWAKTNHPTGDPIDETNLDNAFESYDLIKDKLSAADKTLIENWFRQIAQAEINSPKMTNGHTTAMNNWNSHRLKIVGEIAWVLNDDKLKKYTIDNLKKQLEANLNADGTTFDFLQRDALHYHAYDLEPLVKLAIVIKRNAGTDFYNYETDKGASIAKSVNFLAPFVTGEKAHAEFVNSKVSFDAARAKNGEQGYISGTLFKPTEGIETISLAAWFNPRLLEAVRKAKNDESKFTNWQTVLNEVEK